MLAGAWVGGVAAVSGLVAMILIAIDKVSAGHALETYRTHWMVEGNWIAFLVFVVVTIVVVLVAAVVGWLQRRSEQREVQRLQAKYSAEQDG